MKILCVSNPKAPSTKKLKKGEFTSLNLRITAQNNNIITDGPQVTVVLHICNHKIASPIKMEYEKRLKPRMLPQNTQGNKRNQTKSNCHSQPR